MKKLESNSVSESFGLNSIEIDELYSINGGFSVSIGECQNIGSITTTTPSGAYPVPTNPSSGPSGSASSGSSGSGK